MIQNPVIVFDGVCNLCNGIVDFIHKRDKKKQFRFVSLQSEAGKMIFEKMDIPREIDSVVLIYRNSAYFESDAALKTGSLLPFPWRLLVGFKIFPVKWRNKMYKWISRNRYQWFGKKSECRIPTPEEKKYFPGPEELNV